MSQVKGFLRNWLERVLSMRRAVQFVWESAPRWTAASAALLVIEGLLPVAGLYTMKLMLDAVSAALASADPLAGFNRVAFTVGLAAGIAVLTSVARTAASLVTAAQSRVVVDHMYDILHAKSIEVDLEYYENAQYYDTLHRAQEQASYRPIQIVNGLTMIFRSTISLLGVVGLLFSFHWSVGLVLLVAVLPNAVVRVYFSRKTFQLQRQYTGDDRKAWYYHWMLTAVDFAKEIRIFGLGPIFIREYQQLRDRLRSLRLKLDIDRSGLELLAQIIANAAVYTSYGFIAYRTLSGFSTLGDLVMFYQAFQRGQGFLQDLLGGITSLYENNLFLSNLYEFLDLKRTVLEPASPRAVPRPITRGIEFDHIRFQYPNTEREAIEDVSLAVRPGEVIALVGENGSGKTTLMKLLLRLYEPTRGAIRIDGTDICQFTTPDLRREVSIIFQDYAHYNLSARDNIWYGNVEEPPDDARITAAARHAGAHEVIASLHDGYDTVLGKLFERGEELSTGQWQKIALARAFLRNAQIIVLDEPTSAMDPKAEYEVFMKFRELLEGRMAILISHRLSTVRMADRIYVLQNGRVVESGGHEDLVASNGIYAHLFEKQAQYYR